MPTGLSCGNASRTASNTSSGKRMRFCKRAAILIGALVGDRRQELMQQIAVRGVHLDGVDAEPLGALGRRHEGVAHALQPRRVERQRRRLALLVRDRRGALRPPAAFGERDQLPAVPRRVARCLAAGMRELDHHGGLRALAHRGQDRLQRGFGGVVVEAETAGRDAADRLHRGRLDAEDRSPRQRQRIDVGEVPVIGLAVDGRVLAHRRHHDAVGKVQAAQLDRGKQSAHGMGSGPEGKLTRHV